MSGYRRFWVLALLASAAPPFVVGEAAAQARAGAAVDAAATRESLAAQAREHPRDITALTSFAEFLDRHGDPAAREAYRNLLSALANGDASRRAAVARRLARLDLLEGDGSAASRDLDAYTAASGNRLTIGDPAKAQEPADRTVMLAGPFRSFVRMAALSPEVAPEEVLPGLARNVINSGYQAAGGKDTLEPTEYLKLIHRYLSQAAELQAIAGEGKAIRIEKCDSPQTGELLRVLGCPDSRRLRRGGCAGDRECGACVSHQRFRVPA